MDYYSEGAIKALRELRDALCKLSGEQIISVYNNEVHRRKFLNPYLDDSSVRDEARMLLGIFSRGEKFMDQERIESDKDKLMLEAWRNDQIDIMNQERIQENTWWLKDKFIKFQYFLNDDAKPETWDEVFDYVVKEGKLVFNTQNKKIYRFGGIILGGLATLRVVDNSWETCLLGWNQNNDRIWKRMQFINYSVPQPVSLN